MPPFPGARAVLTLELLIASASEAAGFSSTNLHNLVHCYHAFFLQWALHLGAFLHVIVMLVCLLLASAASSDQGERGH